MSIAQKLDLAVRIEALGVDCVEAGFPASSPSDFEATRLIAGTLTRARFATFCRALRRDVDAAVSAGGPDNHVLQIMATGSQIHLKHKRGITDKQAVTEIVDTVEHARSLGVEIIAVGIEDASRGDDELLRALTESAVEAGARYIPIADTSGCMTPDEYGELIAKIRSWAPPPVRIGTHCHDDFGLALANAVAGVQAGADDVQVTLGGIGERAGNTALEELCALVAYKGGQLGLRTDIDLAGMYEAYNVLRSYISLDQPRNKPIFGTYAFGTAAGIHQHGMLRNPATYEFVEPSRFGRRRSLLVARHSGRAILRHLLDSLDVEAGDALVDELYRVHIAERQVSDAEELDVLRARLAEELLPAPLAGSDMVGADDR